MDWTRHVCVVTDKVLYMIGANLLVDEIMISLLINREPYISRTLNGQNKL
jgi:hypothetical protein